MNAVLFHIFVSMIIPLVEMATPYSTNFSSYDAAHWVLETDCGHCGGSGHGDECTQFATDSIQFSADNGAIITTIPLNKPSECGKGQYTVCKSGHMQFNTSILYGTFTVKAKWFPGDANQVNTSTGFIGLDSLNDPHPSITFGFHGKGWLGHNDEDFSHEFQTGCYANQNDPHNRVYIKTPNTNLAHDINEYVLIWNPDQVIWKLNGVVMRTVTNKTMIPNIAMQPKLHSRSGYCDQMPKNDSFYCQFTYWEYTPYTGPI